MNGSSSSRAARSSQNPPKLIVRAFVLWFQGRIHFVRSLDKEFMEDQGQRFTAFRKVILRVESTDSSEGNAIFQVRFKFKNLPLAINRLLSLIPIPLIIAQPGFRSKTWFLGDQTGEFIGYYEFASVEYAEAYWNSLPLRMMRRRAAPGSLSKGISLKTS